MMSESPSARNSEISPDRQEQILYRTASICPRCAILDSKGIVQVEGVVIERNHRVYLRDTLYCSDSDFFKKTLKFSFELPGAEIPMKFRDIEDLNSRSQYNSQSTNSPFALELSLWEDSAFVSDDEIADRVRYFKTLYPPDRQFVLKVLGRLCDDMDVLNRKTLYVSSLLEGHPIILEASYERLSVIARMEDSVLLRASIFPAIKYYLKADDEKRCQEELTQLFSVLKGFSDMQLMVTLCVSRPYPDMSSLLRFLREQYGFIRIIVVSMESCEEIEKKLENGIPLNTIESHDVIELMSHIQKCTYNSLTTEDFHPVSLTSLMEPFLNIMGYGHYFIRPSPYCGYITCLVNTEKLFTSYPVTRLFDFEQIFEEMKPILPRLQDGKVGFYNANKLRKVFMRAQNANKGPLPDLYVYLTDKSKAAETRDFLQNLQFFVVHNNMDISSIDLVRRCNCALATHASGNNEKLIACCTGCL
ncbi:hypothetical protein PROFUN_11363 [Planoprotostelium fungivorum]|uniref:Uncharacterized protein n=1 Tax=Planoprotostelium fungivorum TaxID=1890364 RepID=A0A2P6NAE5_9EUKA|nr:hypothetical protein PROFUN_11363 [Planoprotostelium fungivorum]